MKPLIKTPVIHKNMMNLFAILSIIMLSSCSTINELVSFEKEPYQSPRAQHLEVDTSFTYQSILKGKIAFINLNLTAPRTGKGIDIDDEIGAPIPPYSYRFHEYLAKHRPDIPWVGPRDIYYKLGNNDFIAMHNEFSNDGTQLKKWLDKIKNDDEPIARYIATADRFLEDYSKQAEIINGYRHYQRTMTIRLDIFDTFSKKRVWSGEMSRSTQEHINYNSEMWFFNYIALDLANNLPNNVAQIPIQK